MNFDILDQIIPERLFRTGNGKIALVRVPIYVTYYFEPFRNEAAQQNVISVSLLFLVAEKKNPT